MEDTSCGPVDSGHAQQRRFKHHQRFPGSTAHHQVIEGMHDGHLMDKARWLGEPTGNPNRVKTIHNMTGTKHYDIDQQSSMNLIGHMSRWPRAAGRAGSADDAAGEQWFVSSTMRSTHCHEPRRRGSVSITDELPSCNQQ